MATGIPYFPQILAPQVVVGRLSEEPGPAEAIPFAALQQAFLAIALTGAALAGDITFTGTAHAGLILNNLTTAQRDAIVAPPTGALIYNTTVVRPNFYDGTGWRNFAVVEDNNGFTATQVFAPLADAGVAIVANGVAPYQTMQINYGSAAAPLAPGADLINGHVAQWTKMYTNGDMTVDGSVVAVVGDSYRNAGKNGIACGGLFRGFNGGTWVGDTIDGGVVALQSWATTTRGGVIFGFNANLVVTTTPGAIAIITEYDSRCEVNVLSKHGLIIVSDSADVGNATGTVQFTSGTFYNDSAAIYLTAVSGATTDGAGWMYGLKMVGFYGEAARPVRAAGSLFLADQQQVARGLDWHKMSFSDYAIGLGNTQTISWRNAANNAFINAVTVDSSDRVSLYGGQLTISALGLLSVGGYALAAPVTHYNVLFDLSGRSAVLLGDTTDPTNYHRNLAHWFQSVAGATTYLKLENTGVTMPQYGVGIATFDSSGFIRSSTFDTDGTLAANSDTRVSTQKAVKAYADTKVAGALDTDGTLAANSDTRVASQKATKTYVDQISAANDAMIFKGVIDASSNPNYPAADRGWTYRISVAGKIGGASGINVEAGDLIICLTDGTSAGTQAGVGSSWSIAQANIDGAVVGPSSATDSNFAQFDGTTGKLIKGGLALDTDGALAANSDVKVASQKATKTYADLKAAKASNLSDLASPKTAFDTLSVHGADVASASTIDLDAATGSLIDVTGSTTITTVTLAEGRVRWVRFTGALILTHGASLVMPGAGNITTIAGDYACFRGYAAGVVRCSQYQRASDRLIRKVVKQVFTSSGTYTPTPGMTYCIIEAMGAGGGGGGVDGTTNYNVSASGGGGGGYSRLLATAADIGASQTVTIGAGGGAGSAGAHDGSAGGDTSVGSLCVAKGGSGGPYATAGIVFAGGAGGVAGTGDFASTGPRGLGGVAILASVGYSFIGGGASTMWGTAGLGPIYQGTGGGGLGYGAGGGVSLSIDATDYAGGPGAPGLVVITEYIA